MPFDGDFFSFIRKFHLASRSTYCDLADFASSYGAAVLFTVLTVVHSGRTFLGDPIECWTPKQFSNAWNAYAKQVCWLEGTYWVHESNSLPPVGAAREGGPHRVVYYQWVAFFFLVMAVLSYIPYLVWKLVSSGSGTQFQASVQHLSSVYTQSDTESRDKTMKEAASFIWFTIRSLGSQARCSWCCCCHLFFGYFIYKIITILNLMGQIVACWYFIGMGSILFGLELTMKLAQGYEWEHTGNFPRVTMCDFKVRALGNMHPYTIQCTLPINMLNEKFFILIWYYFVFALTLTCLSTLKWLIVTLFPGNNRRLIKGYLLETNALSKGDSECAYIDDFMNSCLGSDGMFFLRMLSRQVGNLLVAQVTAHMWYLYKQDRRKRADGCSQVEGLNNNYV